VTPPAKPLPLDVAHGALIPLEITETGDYRCVCRNCLASTTVTRRHLLWCKREKSQYCSHCQPCNASCKHEQQPRRAGKFVSRLEMTG
jgi:hypothetical protein